jgi:hypothetical protein
MFDRDATQIREARSKTRSRDGQDQDEFSAGNSQWSRSLNEGVLDGCRAKTRSRKEEVNLDLCGFATLRALPSN